MSNGIALNETKVIDHATKEYILIMHNVLSLIAFLWCSQIPYLIGLNPKIERTKKKKKKKRTMWQSYREYKK